MTSPIETEMQRRQREYLETVADRPAPEANSFEEAVEIAQRMQSELQQ